MDNTTIADKIRKLLALSKSPNEAEAISALAKAHEMLRKYNLDIDQIINAPEKSIVDEPFLEGSRARKWKLNLLQEIATFNYCKVYKTVLQNAPVKNVRKVSAFYFSVVGREANVASCKVMAEYIFSAIDNASLKIKGEGRLTIESFKVGFSFSVIDKLQKLAAFEIVHADCKALVIKEDKIINDFFEKLQTKKVSLVVDSKDIEGFVTGRKEGEKLSLNRQIDTQKQQQIN